MTTERNEIEIQGSNDNKNWTTLDFKYKPGDVNRAPPVVGKSSGLALTNTLSASSAST